MCVAHGVNVNVHINTYVVHGKMYPLKVLHKDPGSF